VRNAYQILGLRADASEPEIRAAYKRLVRHEHPDRAGAGQEAHERFLEIKTAYQILIDPRSRAEHDRDPDGTLEARLVEERRRAQLARRRKRLRRLYE
jgi:molecular chaperone DnaJ